jgi:hypothetical protein
MVVLSPTGATTILTPVTGLGTIGGINNLGQIVGSAGSGGFLYTPGKTSGANPTVLDISGPNGEGASLSSINDAGWILGQYYDGNGVLHCLFTKPPYDSPVSFDYIGSAGCTTQLGETTVLNGLIIENQLEINGIGQIAGATETGPDIDDGSVEWSQLFVDDIENGSPGPSDNLAILYTTAPGGLLGIAGINNNGQIAGSFLTGDDLSLQGPLQGFFVNTDDTVIGFPLFDTYFDFLFGLNDDVQMAGSTGANGGSGFTIDSQH